MHWLVVGVLCLLSLARRLAVNSFRQLYRVRQCVETVLRRHQVAVERSSLVAGLVVVVVAAAAAAAAVYSVALRCWTSHA